MSNPPSPPPSNRPPSDSPPDEGIIRRRVMVRGVVQGVGFRPFVYGLALHWGLSGFVGNESGGVFAEVEGPAAAVEGFLAGLAADPPPLAHVAEIRSEAMPVQGGTGFVIVHSQADPAQRTLVSPDVSVCDACLAEMADPEDRRFGYPFINCTHCGPRFTIIRDIPYDRPLTTMADFPLCPDCEREYHDPLDRRFHAQPIACPVCGPRVWLEKGTGDWGLGTGDRGSGAGDRGSGIGDREIGRLGDSGSDSGVGRVAGQQYARRIETHEAAGQSTHHAPRTTPPIPNSQFLIRNSQLLLASGYILAIKGLGGFHLACDATNADAVARLRQRKGRSDKPFALMVADVDAARRIVHLSPEAEALLTSRERPILLLPKRPEADDLLSPLVAPGNDHLGVMLPYTPLHYLVMGGLGTGDWGLGIGDRGSGIGDWGIGRLGDSEIGGSGAESGVAPQGYPVAGQFQRIETHEAADDDPSTPPAGLDTPGKQPPGYPSTGSGRRSTDAPQSTPPIPNPQSPVPSPQYLIMTSANASGEPMIVDNDEARRRLAGVADWLLLHDRPIHARCDDSVVRIFRRGELPVRRSRGYAPFPVTLPAALGELPPILAVGGELKSTFCLAQGRSAFLSQHIGDMENLETLAAFQEAVDYFERIFRIEPAILACDLHPGYLSGQWAEEQATGQAGARPLVRVQHHHAHIAGCMAEHGLDGAEPALGLCFDGTGYGDDAAIWGGEALLADYRGYQRLAHLAYVPLPGGDAAVRRPYRMALAHLWAAGMEWSADLPCVLACPPEERRILARQLERGLNTVPTSSMGRLFDAAASLLGLRHQVTYEAQAAIELESLARQAGAEGGSYPVAWAEGGAIPQLDPAPLWAGMIRDLRQGVAPPRIAARFHNSVADMALAAALRIQKDHPVARVVLSGGVFQNVTLLTGCVERLTGAGFHVLTHRRVPPNDGGLALGQAVVAGCSPIPSWESPDHTGSR